VYERDADPDTVPRVNPDRSYTIDITGHGLRALRYIGVTESFDTHLLPFKGIQHKGRVVDEWPHPGWTGSRADIVRALTGPARGYPQIEIRYGAPATDVDVHAGTVDGASYDLVVGADGAGSKVRAALQAQVPGFTVESSEIANFVTMIELDRADPAMDQRYLHALSIRHFCIAGAIRPDEGATAPRWFAAVGSGKELSFASPEQARAYLADACPPILEMASDEAVMAFAGRTSYHVGRSVTCSQLNGGRTALIGDAAAPFPPIGQGVNAAMESAMVLDEALAHHAPDVPGAVAAYSGQWKPEADAVTWISERVVFDKPLNTLRNTVTMAFGVNVVGQAKSVDRPYSEIRREARKLGPVWG
jgi:2-polyprenyl-6-methoxyphenol hydroxylase-like FAD-dependent oxidoreductase